MAKMNLNIYNTKDYKNFIPLAGQKKQTQFKPKKTQFAKV